MKWITGLAILLFAVAAVMCNATLNAYQPTVNTAVDRSMDTVDRVVDEHYADDPLEDAMMVHETVTGDRRLWMVVAFLLFGAVSIAAIITIIYFRAKYAEKQTKLIRAQTAQQKALSSPTSTPSTQQQPWVTVSEPQQLSTTPTAQRPLYLPLPNESENNESWTQ